LGSTVGRHASTFVPDALQRLRQHIAGYDLGAKITGHFNSGSSPLLSVNHANKEPGARAQRANEPNGYYVKKTRYRRCRCNRHIIGNPTEPPKDSRFSTSMAKIQPINKHLASKHATLGDQIQPAQQNSTNNVQTQTRPTQGPKRAKMQLNTQQKWILEESRTHGGLDT